MSRTNKEFLLSAKAWDDTYGHAPGSVSGRVRQRNSRTQERRMPYVVPLARLLGSG